jgi:chemotaxis signal transduction protein
MEQQPRTLQLFDSGGAQFAVFLDEVMSISEWREPAVLLQAPASVLGVISIHGRMLTVLDLSQLLETQQRTETTSHILALNGDEQLALAIGKPGETTEISAVNSEEDPGSQLVSRVIDRNGDEIKILNVKELFPTAIQGRERRRRRV